MSKLGFVVGHPTQFEVPFYRFLSTDKSHDNIVVYYFSYNDYRIKDRELPSGFHNKWGIDLVSGYHWVRVFKNIVHQSRIILKNNTYVIFNGYTSKLSWTLILMSVILRKKPGLRLDTVLWNNKQHLKIWLKKKWINFLAHFIDVFWVTGKKSMEYLIRLGIPVSRIKVFSYIVDNTWFKIESALNENQKNDILRSYNINPEHQIILAIVKLVKRETPEDLIRAFGMCQLKKATLVVVGDGDMRPELEEKSIKWANGKQVVFTGYISYSELPKMYGIAHLYVHTSTNEPWGVSVQEAIACGLPVIASEYVGSAYDLIVDGQNGRIYKPGHLEELSNFIYEALQWDPNTIRIVNEQILSSWNYETTWNRINKHIDGIVGKV